MEKTVKIELSVADAQHLFDLSVFALGVIADREDTRRQQRAVTHLRLEITRVTGKEPLVREVLEN